MKSKLLSLASPQLLSTLQIMLGILGLVLTLLILFCGCARLNSTTREPVILTGSVIGYRETHATVTTFFDSQSALAKFQNRGQLTSSNEWASGTSIGGLNQAAAGTNFNDLLGTVVGAAVKAAASSAK